MLNIPSILKKVVRDIHADVRVIILKHIVAVLNQEMFYMVPTNAKRRVRHWHRFRWITKAWSWRYVIVADATMNAWITKMFKHWSHLGL